MQGKCKNTSNMQKKKKWFTNTMPRILSQGLLQKISPVKYEKKPNLKLQEDNRNIIKDYTIKDIITLTSNTFII